MEVETIAWQFVRVCGAEIVGKNRLVTTLGCLGEPNPRRHRYWSSKQSTGSRYGGHTDLDQLEGGRTATQSESVTRINPSVVLVSIDAPTGDYEIVLVRNQRRNVGVTLGTQWRVPESKPATAWAWPNYRLDPVPLVCCEHPWMFVKQARVGRRVRIPREHRLVLVAVHVPLIAKASVKSLVGELLSAMRTVCLQVFRRHGLKAFGSMGTFTVSCRCQAPPLVNSPLAGTDN